MRNAMEWMAWLQQTAVYNKNWQRQRPISTSRRLATTRDMEYVQAARGESLYEYHTFQSSLAYSLDFYVIVIAAGI